MKTELFQEWRKFLVIPLLIIPLLFTGFSCVAADEAELIESLLDNLDSMGGEMNFVTKDGKTITITVNQEPSTIAADENEECNEEKNTEEPENEEKHNSSELSEYLPELNCIEDVFKALDIWESADVLYDQVQNWTHVAEELGYNHETMYAALKVKIQNQLHEAKVLGLISYEQYEYKVNHYNEKALKWVNEIF